MQLQQSFSMKQELKLKQMLSPKIIHMLKMFNSSYLDLENSIQKESQDNVLLEVNNQGTLIEYAASKRKASNSEFMGKDISDFAKDNTADNNMYEYLTSQLNLEHLVEKEYQIGLIFIENLDSRGYLNNYPELKETIKSKFKIADRKIHDILKIIHSFEPDGIGARSLKEALLIQVDQHQFENRQLQDILKKVITYHLDDLSENMFDKIAKKLNIEPDGIAALANFIKQNLNPNPGSMFSSSQFTELIIPSFEVSFSNNKVILNNLEKNNGIQVKVSNQHTKLLNNPDTDEKTKNYLQEKLVKAKEIVENIQKRHETLEKLISYIVKKQHLFIEKGTIYLEPLLQKEIAEELHISGSTVSRIVSSKYIETPHGTFAFKQLCPRSHFGKTSERLKIIIQYTINKHPSYSDKNIAKVLNNDGLEIARRTVNKYRNLIDLDTSK
jgi:RNA polymerase sigma-54 factor